ncbi:MAG: hypothetical protein K0S04_3449 [Herbinix sp.]|nr:hypothetical protein [Herbinix sp.]
MQALGLIEVYGYLSAVVALDSALKSAEVHLVDVVKVKGGLVTVLIIKQWKVSVSRRKIRCL